MSDALRRAGRTLLQLIAAGGLTALIAALVDGLDTKAATLTLAGWTVFVTYVQNLLEDKGTLHPVLGTKPDTATTTTTTL
jgi:hypothetical protein